MFAAIIPGAIISMLFFFDHEVSFISCTIDRYGTMKPGGFAWDIVLLGSSTALCGVLGIRPAHGLLLQALLHSESLMHAESEERTITMEGEEKTKSRLVRRVYEQSSCTPGLYSAAIHACPWPHTNQCSGWVVSLYGRAKSECQPHSLSYLLPAHTAVGATDASTFNIGRQSTKVGIVRSNPWLHDCAGGCNHHHIRCHFKQAAPAFPVFIIALVSVRLHLMNRSWRQEA